MLLTRNKTQFIARVALLIALSVVVRRVLTPQVAGLNLGGFPILLSGLLLGPVGGAYVGAVSDIIGFWVTPVGPFNPFYTATAALTGFLPPLFLRDLSGNRVLFGDSDLALLLRLFVALLATQLITKVLLQPMVNHLLWGWPVVVTALHNLAIQLLHVPCYSVLIFSVLKSLRRNPRLQWAV